MPAGRRDAGETPEAGARRELEEEVGARAGALELVATFFSSPGFCDEAMHLFRASGLTLAEARPEPDERIEVRWVLARRGPCDGRARRGARREDAARHPARGGAAPGLTFRRAVARTARPAAASPTPRSTADNVRSMSSIAMPRSRSARVAPRRRAGRARSRCGRPTRACLPAGRTRKTTSPSFRSSQPRWPSRRPSTCISSRPETSATARDRCSASTTGCIRRAHRSSSAGRGGPARTAAPPATQQAAQSARAARWRT